MHILIAERLKPFSHSLKNSVIIPGTHLFIEVYPAFILVHSLSKDKPELVSKIEINLEGPVSKFTVQLNLEKGYLLVFGDSASGYFRYRLSFSLDEKKLFIAVEKEGKKTLVFKQIFGTFLLHMGQNPDEFLSPERLSLGNHKQQDFELIKRRQDLKEILPIWLKTGGFYKEVPVFLDEGTGSLLKEIEKAIEKSDTNHLSDLFKTLFNSSFEGMMVPSLTDLTHQGLKLPPVKSLASPLFLLSYGAKLIRSLFVRFKKNKLELLPALPKEFHSGRFLHAVLENAGMLDLEWSKKTMRRMILFANKTFALELKLPKEIKRFRLKSNGTSEWIKTGTCLKIEKDNHYFFDRFEK
ncbi:MAG TPA: hypothetical protein PLC42_00380 [Parachlamydiaceae bacterium]|nr:hypothetical protein [Parachlamydiaceae bacterium]